MASTTPLRRTTLGGPHLPGRGRDSIPSADRDTPARSGTHDVPTPEFQMKSKSTRSKVAHKAKQRRRAARRQGVIKVRKPGQRMKGKVSKARNN